MSVGFAGGGLISFVARSPFNLLNSSKTLLSFVYFDGGDGGTTGGALPVDPVGLVVRRGEVPVGPAGGGTVGGRVDVTTEATGRATGIEPVESVTTEATGIEPVESAGGGGVNDEVETPLTASRATSFMISVNPETRLEKFVS